MKITHLLTVLIQFVAACSTSFALLSVGNLSRERADELGIELRTKPGGPKHAWIELEFKPEGKLSKFQHVSLEIPDGDQLGLGWTPLKETRTSSGSVIVRVMGSRKCLENITLRIVCGELKAETGLDVKIKDFVDFDQLPESKPSKELPESKPSKGSNHDEQDGADQPATVLDSKPE